MEHRDPEGTHQGGAGPTADDIQEAIAQAHEHLKAKGVVTEPDPEEPEDGPGPQRRRLWILGCLLVATILGTALLQLLPRGSPTADQREADLRWAVGQVVSKVESFDRERGRLPSEEELFGLLSEAVEYVPLEDGFVVRGKSGGIDVEYDGRVPLDSWLRGPNGPEGGER